MDVGSRLVLFLRALLRCAFGRRIRGCTFQRLVGLSGEDLQ